MADIITEHDELIRRTQELGGQVVLADGAFDLLHPGHISFLEAAKEQGGALVVALHTDDIVRSNKGSGRPLNPWADRARVLAAVAYVDLVVRQDDRCLDDLIRDLKPAVLAKGTDFVASGVGERELVESFCGVVVICGEPKSHSVAQVAGHAEESGFRPAWDGAREVDAEPGKLTIIVPTKNEEHNIRECLESARWADELIVCDSFSSDQTAQIAQAYTPNVVQHEYIHSAAQKNWIIPQASSEWVMILDADERITPELQADIKNAIRRGDEYDGFRVARRTHFLGKLIRHCGWDHDRPLRVFKRDKGRYENREVHAAIIDPGNVGQLDGHLIHYTDRDLKNYFEKFDRYSSLKAADTFRRGEKFRLWALLVKPPVRFLKMYILNLGFLDGFHGLLLCGLSTMSVFARYAKLWELERRGSVGELPHGRPD